MGRASQRKRHAHRSQGAHEDIAAEAQRAKNAAEPRLADSGYPALDSLIQTARRAIGDALPASFVHEGREYWCRVSIGIARLNVFASPTTSEPLMTSIFGSSDDFGHNPFH